MDIVTVSPKFQVVIPKNIRKDLNIRPGEKIAVIEKGETIHLIRVGTVKKLKGFAAGASTKGLRDERDRFD